eukprot:CAMPEP_0171104388 /NCGR_PEP_ID=MMETSP0766_2-20121228/60531_1 /TAXON_ID=439317 /ORGANISM="Gambierdiscus australes, Strain CAWD 149" /LENGTH=341 /DNA_ID=CAMNT_0011565007 /DNA_START=69 /DNA_END=1094 /DNA_ORIENTATION=-
MPQQRLLVTGVSGFVGSHVAVAATERGYLVRGTVRSMDFRAKLEELVPNIELVEVDLVKSSQEEWVEAVRGCDGVCHVASPFPVKKPQSEDELIQPAVEGTKKVLAACHAAGIKRVVVTSSSAAIGYGHEGTNPPKTSFTAEDWSITENCPAYQKSKTLAERAARDYATEVGLELVTINPTYIQGPLLHQKDASSCIMVRRLLEGNPPMVPPLGMNICDVRDVAMAHLLALEKPDVAGGRFIVDSGPKLMTDVGKILGPKFPLWSVPTWEAPYILISLISWFDDEIAAVLPRWRDCTLYDAEPTKQALGMELRSIETAVTDMATSMEKLGMLNMQKKKAAS